MADQVQDAALDEVHVGDQAVDRVGPRVVLGVMLHERQHPQHAPALLAGEAERPGRQRAGTDQVELGDAAAGHGRPPAAVGLDDLVDRDQVLEQAKRVCSPTSPCSASTALARRISSGPSRCSGCDGPGVGFPPSTWVDPAAHLG
jgi:hypothetical protein